MMNVRALSLALVVFAALAPAALAQEAAPPDTSAFAGWEQWPLITPTDLDLDTDALSNQRIVFDGIFGPPGQGRPVTMYMDVFEHWYGERPSFWIQWTSSGNPTGAPEGMGIDALIVDRADLRILFRVAAVGQGGLYAITRHGADETEQYRVDMTNDTVSPHRLEGEHPTFDFAAFPFLFPFLDLQEGRRFRLPNVGQPPELVPGEIAVLVAGRIALATASGVDVDVWDVQVMPAHGRAIIHFYVTDEAPFFHGWDYRVAGGMVATMRIFDWQPMLVRAPREVDSGN